MFFVQLYHNLEVYIIFDKKTSELPRDFENQVSSLEFYTDDKMFLELF